MYREIHYYQTKTGRKPFIEWFEKLKDPVTIVRVKRRLDRLQEGYYGDCKSLGKQLWELRLNFGAGYRIYFTEYEGDIFITFKWR